MVLRLLQADRGRLPALLVAVMALLCLWLLARMVAGLLDAGSRDDPAQVGTSTIGTQATARESLAQWHLFGNAFAITDARTAAASDAPDTTLDLTLVGILAETGDPEAGVAMIADASGSQAAYRAGTALPGGARVRQILPDRVLLAHNGRDEVLRLPREAANAGAAGTPPSASAPTGNESARPAPGNAMAPVAVAGLETVDWGEVRKQLNVDPAELAKQVRVQPVREGGTVVGVRLSGNYAALLAGVGLQPDDIITAVNGVSVNDSARAQQVIGAVARERGARVTVRRNGREETLDVSLQ